MARPAAWAAIVVALVATVGCGETSERQAITDMLDDAGYSVDVVESVSAFKPDAETALAVEGNGIPEGNVVGVEIFDSEADAREIEKQYDKINAPVVVLDSVVYSALEPVPQDELDAVVEAAGG